jgi:hypothetical protein
MNTVLGLSPFWTFVVAAVVGILGAARLTRLFVDDSFPIVVKFQDWWDKKTRWEAEDESPWAKLFHCPWCLGPWMTLIALATAWASNLHVAWWVFYGWLAASYVVSYVVFHDED